MNKETLEEAAEKYFDYNIFCDGITDFEKEISIRSYIAGAKWQQEMYSEEDLRESFKSGGKMSWTDINQETQEPYYYDFNEWFEQFKKKS